MLGLEEKTRDNYAHHAKDAVVVACCTRDMNDALANYYHDLEQFEFYGKPKPSFSQRIPWKGFNDDVKEFDSNILISHHTPDVFSTQSKKAIRKRGIIQRNENGEIKYKQGDTVRGALHKESFYGAILREELDKKTGKAEEVVKYVKRQSIGLFKDTDFKKIVDYRVREIVLKDREQEKLIKKEIEELNKQMKNLKEEKEQQYNEAIELLKNKMKNELYVLPNSKGSPFPIKKIRYFTNDISNPLLIKKHRDISRHEHKQHYFAKNDGNYCFAIYEGKDKKNKFVTEYKVVNNYEAGKYYNSKANTHKFPLEFNIEDKSKNVLELKFLLKTGTLVLFYKKIKDEVWELDNLDLAKRLHKTVAIEADGRIQFRLHSTSKPDGQLEKSSEINFEIANEKLRLSKSVLNVIVEGFDFKISSMGKISKM